MSTVPAGWYPDPSGEIDQPDVLRYWDGSLWTEHIHIPHLPPPPPGPTERGFVPGAAQFAGTGEGWPGRVETTLVKIEEPTRRSLVWETRFVMVAFLVPGIVGAVVLLAQHVSGVGNVTRFPVYVDGHPVTNLLVGMVAYLPTACMVPLALFLLSRTGDTAARLGLGWPRFKMDILPALGLVGASVGSEFVILIPLAPLLAHHSSLISQTTVGHVPDYYVIWGIMISATTAVAEEILMNGYLMTRLHQLGWTPRSALTLAIVLRTSYHVYYGLGFILTVPFAYFMTRSFQKNNRLTRTIAAHFLLDSILVTLSILT